MNTNYKFYEHINISNVINKLHLRKTSQIGNNIYVVCPFCQENNEKVGYMKANIINNLFICNKCEKSGTSISLYADLKYITNKEAYKILLREMPVLDNLPYTFINPIKDEYYRNLVYDAFLKLQSLSVEHKEKLENVGFSKEYIASNGFKSIETDTIKKKKICKEIQDKGLKLDGIPGFYQDNDFKWTYKSHQGIFIPVVLDNNIQGIRIWLDDRYGEETENIWFSSNNEYNGTKATNWPMILRDNNLNWIDMYNTKNQSIIIATEMILAHKLFYNTNKVVIGIPNNINKEIILNIVKRLNVSEVILYLDKYTVLHTATAIIENIENVLKQQEIKVDVRVAISENGIGKDLIEQETINKKIA